MWTEIIELWWDGTELTFLLNSQVEVLELPVRYDDYDVIPYSELRNKLSECGCELNIIWFDVVNNKDELLELNSSLHQNPVSSHFSFLCWVIDIFSSQIKNLRLHMKYEPTLEDFKSFIRESKLKNLPLVFDAKSKFPNLRGRELIQKAESSEIQLEVHAAKGEICFFCHQLVYRSLVQHFLGAI